MSERGLTPKQRKFVEEYLIDLNATQAAIRAGYSADTAHVQGPRLLENVRVRSLLEASLKERSARTKITADKVLQHWWDIATADPNDITHLRRVNCRHCWGKDHQYQWRDVQEYEKAIQMAVKVAEAEGKEPIIPSDVGGYEFKKTADPNPDCPYCWGEGVPELHIEDTRKLRPKAKLLYAGVKQTQAGTEIKFRDQDKAMENVARHLGMFTDRLEVQVTKRLEDYLDNDSEDDI